MPYLIEHRLKTLYSLFHKKHSYFISLWFLEFYFPRKSHPNASESNVQRKYRDTGIMSNRNLNSRITIAELKYAATIWDKLISY